MIIISGVCQYITVNPNFIGLKYLLVKVNIFELKL